uniref:Uncharacterized protein n=1 Tax=Lactarius sp. (in: basidiomycete fungi) TaxID=1886493 RepID=A0A2Z4M9D8_9AGAM|nr:hypothetical protein [Lactarius sp. (in: basidiomycete fungi)]
MSLNKITYLDQILENKILIISDPYTEIFYFNDSLEIHQFLERLEKDKVYVLSLEFILSWLSYDEDSPVITLSKPILITKNSNPRTISKFISERMNLMIDSYFLDDEIIQNLGSNDGPGVLLKYREINLF